MDIGALIGVVIAVVAVLGSILYGGDLIIFWDTPSVFCVGGGVTAAVFMKWPLENVKALGKIFKKAFFVTPTSAKKTIEEIAKLAEIARRESVFALEKAPVSDAFLKKAMTLAADNRPPEVIQSILQMEVDAIQSRHSLGAAMLDNLAVDGPAFGMIGTLIGLVQMLQNLSDPSAIGPAMAVALLTTFYGSCLANIIAGPFKNRIIERSKGEITSMNIIIAGTLGIVSGENPRLIKEKLSAYLPPSERTFKEEGGE
jgi:chemotaxis protein MotA